MGGLLACNHNHCARQRATVATSQNSQQVLLGVGVTLAAGADQIRKENKKKGATGKSELEHVVVERGLVGSTIYHNWCAFMGIWGHLVPSSMVLFLPKQWRKPWETWLSPQPF